MIKKVLPLALITLTLIATPAFAISEKANDKAQEKSQSSVKGIKSEEVRQNNITSEEPTVTPELTITTSRESSITPVQKTEKKVLGESKSQNSEVENTECDSNASYKNHGEYVSCVARQGLGGQVVSAAAKSDIGKKQVSITPTITPSSTPSATPTVTPPLTSPEVTLSGSSPLQSIAALISQVVTLLKDLI